MENPNFQNEDDLTQKNANSRKNDHILQNGSENSSDLKLRSIKNANATFKKDEANAIEIEFDDDEDDKNDAGIVSRLVRSLHTGFQHIILKNQKIIKILLLIALALLYVIFTGFAIHYNISNNISIDFCDGVGFFYILTGIGIWSLFYYFILKKYFGKTIKKTIFKPINKVLSPMLERWFVRAVIYIAIIGGLCVFLYFDTRNQPIRLVSAGGLVGLILIGLLISKHPGHIQWGQVFWGLGLQFIMGLIVLRWSTGREIFGCLSSKVAKFLDFTNVGSFFVYGFTSEGVNTTLIGANGEYVVLDGVFAFRVLTVIFFFSFFIQLLYHYGIMQFIVEKIGWLLQITIGTTAAESMNAAANIFIGQTEAPLLIKPFLPRMTNSELHAVMTGGFATIAGSVMAAYLSLGIDAIFLLSASVMAAPAALCYSKLLYPETKKSQTTSKHIKFMQSVKSEGTALDSAAQGAMQAVALIGNIIANLIAFMAFVAFLDSIVGWLGSLVGWDVSFQYLLSLVFVPVAYLIGIEGPETEQVARLLGLKTVVNEFVAYQELNKISTLSPRSTAIATYALCSFANISSIGVQLGGFNVLAPQRRHDFAKIILRAFIAGSVAGLLNACIAGTLISAPGYYDINNS